MKTCSKCKEVKPLDHFYNSKQLKDGKMCRCKDCDKIARSNYYKKHFERVRERQRVERRYTLYGLRDEDYLNILRVQDNKCAICFVDLNFDIGIYHDPAKAVVDHCHDTGNVRGVLCTMCNKGIGLLKDDPENVMRAYKYLKKEENYGRR